VGHVPLHLACMLNAPTVDRVINAFALCMSPIARLHTLALKEFNMDREQAAVFGRMFDKSISITELILLFGSVTNKEGALTFIEALPHDHSLKRIIFGNEWLDDDSSLQIVQSVMNTHIKKLSLRGNHLTEEGARRIVEFLKRNKDHSFTNIDLFYAEDRFNSPLSPWQRAIEKEVDELTWCNHMVVEKEAWFNKIMAEHDHNEDLFLRAVQWAEEADDELFCGNPNMLFSVVRELCGLIPGLLLKNIRAEQELCHPMKKRRRDY
jgi:hypothetical protein